MSVKDDGLPLFVKNSDDYPVSTSEPLQEDPNFGLSSILDSIDKIQQPQGDMPLFVNSLSSPGSRSTSPVKPDISTISEAEHNAALIRLKVNSLVKSKLEQHIYLDIDELMLLRRAILLSMELGHDAKPYIQQKNLPKMFRHALRGATVLPDDIPPAIQRLLEGWSHDEYGREAFQEYFVSHSDVENYNEIEDDSTDEFIQPQSGMHGIIITRKPGRKITYSLDPNYLRRSFKFIGHNGLKVGTWWPKQICALRDGAHGSIMGGISGSSEKGAYSIVLSKNPDYDDRDTRDVISYTGSGPSNSHQKMKAGNLALKVSCDTGRPVRVLRSSKLDSPFAPTKGLRYDGLYRVTNYRQMENKFGYRIWKFRLERLRDQDPMVT